MRKPRFNSNFILVLVFFIGLSLLLYPSVSDWWNSKHQTKAIVHYSEAIAAISPEEYAYARSAAVAYNASLPRDNSRYIMTEEQREEYNSKLNLAGDSIMGIIEIPDLDLELPIYHSTSEGVLQVAIGHFEGSSLPVGGKGTHSALSGHRGLPSARLFTDVDKLMVGDIFMLHVLDETLTYEIDQILIVLPYELDGLAIDEEKDYCTLITCTPYGINTHRLLIRGIRIETLDKKAPVRVVADAVQVDSLLVATAIAAPILAVLLFQVMLRSPKKKQKKLPSWEDVTPKE